MIKIAIVSDDHETISAHFGRALFYEIFTVEAGKVIERKTHSRSPDQLAGMHGQHNQTGDGHHQHDHNAMIAPISDCQVLVAGGMGMGAHISLKEHGIQPVITEIGEIQAAVKAFLAGTLLDHPERLH
jgi:predicted Fe-Mo cluster-binding NifX family protein